MSLQPIPSTRFRTESFSLQDQFEAWRERISVVFNVAPLQKSAAQGFMAQALAFHLGEMILVVPGQSAGEPAAATIGRRPRATNAPTSTTGSAPCVPENGQVFLRPNGPDRIGVTCRRPWPSAGAQSA